MEDGTKWSYSRGRELAKDGRKVNVGDCALFEAKNAPPLIGIIRSFSVDTEGQAKLSVNWLYRSPDIKLGKGVSLEAAPNEIFYSFHKDEIAAKSLLHPCKVAFLHKGVELPSGVSSFVCRRVYDRASKCLWWLTDREHNNKNPTSTSSHSKDRTQVKQDSVEGRSFVMSLMGIELGWEA